LLTIVARVNAATKCETSRQLTHAAFLALRRRELQQPQGIIQRIHMMF
jgi:hypothetical protein